MQNEEFSTREEAFEGAEYRNLNSQTDRSIGNVVARRFNRRDILLGTLAAPVATTLFGQAALLASSGPSKAESAGSAFREIAAGIDDTDHVAEGYRKQVLLRWGDPITTGLSDFQPITLTAEEQAKRFGYNNDFVAYFPIDGIRACRHLRRV